MTRATREPRPERIFVQVGDIEDLDEFERTLRDKYGTKKIPNWSIWKEKPWSSRPYGEYRIYVIRHPANHEIIGIIAGKVYISNEKLVDGSRLLVDPAYRSWGLAKLLIERAQADAGAAGYSLEIIADPFFDQLEEEEEVRHHQKVLIRFYQQLGFELDGLDEDSGLPIMVWEPKRDT